jgi:hypothetical protein
VNDSEAARTVICWKTNLNLWNNQPFPGYPSSLGLLKTFKTTYPLEVDKAL